MQKLFFQKAHEKKAAEYALQREQEKARKIGIPTLQTQNTQLMMQNNQMQQQLTQMQRQIDRLRQQNKFQKSSNSFSQKS